MRKICQNVPKLAKFKQAKKVLFQIFGELWSYAQNS